MDDLLAVALAHCPHLKLASWRDVLTRDHCYQCMGCGNEITIPLATLTNGGRASEAGIVGLAFGEQWREKIMYDAEYERRWHASTHGACPQGEV